MAIFRRTFGRFLRPFLQAPSAAHKVYVQHGAKGLRALDFNNNLNKAINDPALHKKFYNDWLTAPSWGAKQKYPYWRMRSDKVPDHVATPISLASSRLPDVTTRVAVPRSIRQMPKTSLYSKYKHMAMLERHPILSGIGWSVLGTPIYAAAKWIDSKLQPGGKPTMDDIARWSKANTRRTN